MIRFRIFNFIISKILAFKRRIYIFIFGDFDPYPKHKYISYSPSDYYLKKASSSALKLSEKKKTKRTCFLLVLCTREILKVLSNIQQQYLFVYNKL